MSTLELVAAFARGFLVGGTVCSLIWIGYMAAQEPQDGRS